MNEINVIKQGLYSQGLPIYEKDIQHIRNILYTINKAKCSLETFPNLNKKVPITIIDKRLML